ncbi:MAG: Bud site selection protein 6 [Watsoniomyces obsoletus]|nr:MAG: Bud site selection protein 6 [Watsoniomyces obsoletus]
MQASPGAPRGSQKRPANGSMAPPTSNMAGYGQTPMGASVPMSPSSSGVRNNSSSAKSASYKKTSNTDRDQANQQLSQIEKSVTHLLVATKQLLETLTQWSRHTSTEAEVSDVYVRLGYEFNIASRAFNAIGMDTSDLGNVPELLRTILEDTLSQEASPASLDRYLPRIRDIIINLLHGLKRKQAKLRQKQAKEEAAAAAVMGGPSTRQTSITSAGSGEFGPSQWSEEGANRYANNGAFSPQMGRSASKEDRLSDEMGVPPRSSSVQQKRASPMRQDSANSVSSKAPSYSSSRDMFGSQRSLPVTVQQHQVPTIASPTMDEFRGPTSAPAPASASGSQGTKDGQPVPYLPPPPPPPKQQDALAALQRGGDLERRASRRYSAYQISKHLGASPNGMPMLPPAQHTPVPNRGRDVRESMNAVRTRTSFVPGQQRSPNRRPVETSPVRQPTGPPSIPEEPATQFSETTVTDDRPHKDGPTIRTTLDPRASSPVKPSPEDRTSATITSTSRRVDTGVAHDDAENVEAKAKYSFSEDTAKAPARNDTRTTTPPSTSEARPTTSSPSPQPGKELTLFLQYKSRIKKFVLPDGYNELSVARLQLAFIEKFAWNTHSNGNDLPDIYIQDPVSGVRHELEDLSDVRDRSVLVLNVETLDEVKRHIDEKVAGLGKMVEEVKNVIEGQQVSIQRVSDRQMDAAKDLARLAAGPVAPATNRASMVVRSPVVPGPSTAAAAPPTSPEKLNQLDDIRSLRRDLAVVRQTYSSFVSDVEASMSEIRAKAGSVKSVAKTAAIPNLDSQTGRAYVNKGKKELGEVSDALVNRVDDLQDSVEDLRKDVVTRGVRPLPRQLETVGREIALATTELKKVQEFLKREKPKWSKIWEKELQVVCDDRDLLTMQEALAADLQDDLDNAAQTFSLVEAATKEQMKDSQGGGVVPSRSTSRTLNPSAIDPSVDPVVAKEGVLGEVRALQPNHENRLEAIERAERMRQKELESRQGGEFQKELGSFVEEGRLKKSGGVEEAERQRKARDERIRKEVWERENANGKAKEIMVGGGAGGGRASTGNSHASGSGHGTPTRSVDGGGAEKDSNDAVAKGDENQNDTGEDEKKEDGELG